MEAESDILVRQSFEDLAKLSRMFAIDIGYELLFGAITFPVGLVATMYGVSVGVVTATAAGVTRAAFVISSTPPG
ncbi:hypothetical protein PPL_03721 [Heterostelium album PN500]|uniref:Uncharacterized protein n=1 Tax=Heterostelium pallidum (strain ATCC 26659 / Pp 5 / PN500) TaxID=670386 RepID=D3B6H3_HETP5|nr:hypothetical protein PPL_03721 [Heterostelium album PN500]EFA82943.1 hypothetical protein PPL_03721 [Heterostelium album PN500]|eukprot:XP_020435060.1 hypothetical protein PPL_03721 [Heterostelium album PN500]